MNWNTAAVIGFALVLLAAWLAMREHRWLQSAEVVPGKVTALIATRGSKGGTNYKPQVCFVANDETEHEFVRGYASSPPEFQVGESVFVAYQTPSYEARILTFGQRFGLPTFLAVAGLALLALWAAFKTGPEYVPRIYLRSPADPAQRW